MIFTEFGFSLFLVYRMDGIGNRFVQLQDLQESLLKQIREFKLTGDPTKLPDIVEANRLDDELQDLARELNSPADSSPSNERRRRSQISHQFTLVPTLDIIKTEPNLISISDIESIANTSSRAHSIKSSSVSSPVSSSSRHSSIGPQRVYAVSATPVISTPQSSSSGPKSSSVSAVSSTPQSVLSTPLPVATQLLSPRARRRQIDSFQVPENEPVIIEPDKDEELIPAKVVAPPLPSFGDLMKNFANFPSEESSEVSEIDNSIPLEEAPDVSRSPRRSATVLNFRIPERVVYEPNTADEIASPETKPVEKPPIYLPEPQVERRPVVARLSEPPIRSESPLRDSNRRRSVFSKPETNGSKFWESVHQQRVKMDKISQTLFAITSLLEIHRAESGKIRVGAFGILGEYLFEKQRKWAQVRDVFGKSDAKPNPTIPSIFESVRAVLLIQRYFRRFVQRRRERVEAVKSLAKTESSDARDKLRKRRLERRAEKREEIN